MNISSTVKARQKFDYAMGLLRSAYGSTSVYSDNVPGYTALDKFKNLGRFIPMYNHGFIARSSVRMDSGTITVVNGYNLPNKIFEDFPFLKVSKLNTSLKGVEHKYGIKISESESRIVSRELDNVDNEFLCLDIFGDYDEDKFEEAIVFISKMGRIQEFDLAYDAEMIESIESVKNFILDATYTLFVDNMPNKKTYKLDIPRDDLVKLFVEGVIKHKVHPYLKFFILLMTGNKFNNSNTIIAKYVIDSLYRLWTNSQTELKKPCMIKCMRQVIEYMVSKRIPDPDN